MSGFSLRPFADARSTLLIIAASTCVGLLNPCAAEAQTAPAAGAPPAKPAATATPGIGSAAKPGQPAAKPAQPAAKPAQPAGPGSKPADAKPADAKPGDAKPGDAKGSAATAGTESAGSTVSALTAPTPTTGAAVDAATPEQQAEAGAKYKAGAEAFGAKKYEEALVAFRASYGVVKSPNPRMMVGRCLAELGQYASAYNELTEAEREAQGVEKYAKTAEIAAKYRTELASKVGVVTLKRAANAPASLTALVDGQPAQLEVARAFAPGKSLVRALLDGALIEERTVEHIAGQQQTIELGAAAAAVVPPQTPSPPVKPIDPIMGSGAPAPAPTASGPRLELVIAGGVSALVGLGGVGLGTAFQLGAASDYNELVAACRRDGSGAVICPDSASIGALKTSGSEQQTFASIGFIAGGVLVAGGATLVTLGFLLGHDESGGPPAASVQVVASPTGLGLTGTF